MVVMHTQFYTTFKVHNDKEEVIVIRQAKEEMLAPSIIQKEWVGGNASQVKPV